MLAQIQSLLDAIAQASVSLTQANGAGRAFELLIVTEIAAELKSRGYSIQLLRSDGQIQTSALGTYTYKQRSGGPTGIAPASFGPDGPTSIRFRRSSELLEWEIWNGIQFVGRSGTNHEFDIAIVPKDLGDALRGTGGRPFGHGWVSIECKDVQATGSLDEFRAFVTRAYDTTLLNWHARHFGAAGRLCRIHPNAPTQPGFGNAAGSFRHENQNVYFGFVRRTGFSSGTRSMSNYYFVRRFDNVTVVAPELAAFRTEVCDWIDANLPAAI